MLDLAIVGVFFGYAIYQGLRERHRASANLEEYFLAGRSLPGWKAGISMAATQFAADTPLLVTGLIATAGVFSLWRLWIYAIAFLMMGFLLGTCWRRAGVITDAELSEIRYAHRPAIALRAIKAVYFGTLVNCVVLAMVMFAATRIAEPFLLWNQWLPSTLFSPIESIVTAIGSPLTVHADSANVWILSTNNFISVAVVLFLTTFYSTTGGLRSVVNTDVTQFAAMMLATIAYAYFAVSRAGGWNQVLVSLQQVYSQVQSPFSAEELRAFTPSRAPNWTWDILMVFALQWMIQMNSDGTGYLAQRTMACKSSKDARIAAVVFAFAQVILRTLFWLPIALSLLILFPPEFGSSQFTALREQTFTEGIFQLLPTGVKGLMLTGMLAALASTVDTHLNWGAAYWSQDLYGRIYCQLWKKQDPNPRALVWVGRAFNIVLMSLSLALMFTLGSIQSAWQMSLVFGSALGIPLLLRWFWWRMNSWGELFALAAGLILGPIIVFWGHGLTEPQKLLLMASSSLVACLAGVFAMGPEPMETLTSFYTKVRPSGWWSPVAKRLGHDRSVAYVEFARGGVGTLASSLSLFCLLVGIGSWILESPPPSWFPYSHLWILINLGVGLGLIPLWWKIIRHRTEEDVEFSSL